MQKSHSNKAKAVVSGLVTDLGRNPQTNLTSKEKGDMLRKETYPILKEDKSINFVGNMESRELLSGDFDLVVCDGFNGNVLIK